MKKGFCSIFLLIPLLVTCSHKSVASLTIRVGPQNDTTGTASAIADINFTDFTQPGGDASKLRILFTNPEGDSMLIALSPGTNGIESGTTYNFDGSENTLNLTFTVVSNNTPQTFDVTTTNGFLTLSDYSAPDGIVSVFKGPLQFNPDVGGAAQGLVNISSSN